MMAIAGLFASCQANLEPVVVDEVATVSFEVETPQIATRAYSDGMTATVLQYAVYDANGEIIDAFTKTAVTINISKTVELQLTTGNTYSVLFWAAAREAPYTVDLAAKTMEANYTGVLSNDENLDAFYKYYTFTVKGSQSEKIELKRPFAQLNIGTNDFEASTTAGYTPTQSSVKVAVYSTLNLENGVVDGQETVEFATAAFNTEETFPVDGYEYLAMNYLLVGAYKETVDVEFTYTDGTNAKTRTVGSVPVQRNHRTNLYGQLLTSDVEINVEILPDYDDPNLPETDEEKLNIAAQLGGTVVLSADVELSAPIEVVAPMTIDLGGHTITTKLEREGRHHYAIENYSILTIKGEGAINARGVKNFKNMTIEEGVAITNIDTDGGAAVWNEGEVVINGGTFKTNASAGEGSYGAALNTRTGGKAVVNGGVFEAYSQLTYAIINEGISTVINNATVKAKHGCVAGLEISETVINGGSFELMENPNVSDHCTYFVSDIKGGKFTLGANTDCGAQLFCESKIAEGFEAVVNGDWTYVVTSGIDAVATTADELVEALESGKDVFLAGDVKIDPAGMSNAYGTTGINVKNGQTIDGGNNTLDIKGAGGTWDSGISTTGGLIKNIKVTGSFRGIFVNHNSTHSEKVVLENVVLDGTVYTISCDQGTGKGLDAYNSTFNGWTSYAKTIGEVTFTSCSFGEGSGYAFCRPYAPTVFTDCDFEAGYTVDPVAAIVFDNCRLDGVAITAANVADLVTDVAKVTVK